MGVRYVPLIRDPKQYWIYWISKPFNNCRCMISFFECMLMMIIGWWFWIRWWILWQVENVLQLILLWDWNVCENPLLCVLWPNLFSYESVGRSQCVCHLFICVVRNAFFIVFWFNVTFHPILCFLNDHLSIFTARNKLKFRNVHSYIIQVFNYFNCQLAIAYFKDIILQ